MPGIEYNWLISPARTTGGVPRVRLARNGLLTLAVAAFCFFCVALRAEPPHRALLREAGEADQAGNVPLFIARLEAARALRPDYPRVIWNLARGYAAAGRSNEAMTQLQELAAMGLQFDLATDAALAALRERPDFLALTKTFAARRAPIGRDETAWAGSGMDGIIESVATHPATSENFLGDVRNRCIWHRDPRGPAAALRKFSADTDGLPGVFALKFSADGKTLWASCSAVPEMAGYTPADKGRSFLAAYDLPTGKLRQTCPLPADGRDHVLGDFILAADGGVYVTDSISPVIWHLAPGGTRLEKWLEHGDFVSLQGLAFSPDGQALYVSDYGNGIWRIALASRALSLLSAPAHTTLFGIDGLYAVPGGLVAVQNGVNPQRILRLDLDPRGLVRAAHVLVQGQPAMTDLGLGQISNGHFDFIGNSGWSLYENPAASPARRNVVILRTPVN